MIAPPLTGVTVTLRTWEVTEAARYLDLRDDLVFRFTTESVDLDLAAAGRNIESARSDPNMASFAICVGDIPVGNLSASRLGRKVVISYWVSAEERGRGLATEALRLATEWAAASWEPAYLELEIDPANHASMAVAAAAGYSRHGLRLESACGGPALLFRRV